MKIAPILQEMKTYGDRFCPFFIHTGQHYDDEMSRIFLQELGLPEPDVYLGAGSGSHGSQTAKVMIAFEKVMMRERPDIVVVVGDVNSTLACALVASKMWVPIAHVEAGLRSFDRTMPEEINRMITDQLSDYLFTTCKDANKNLKREGIPTEKTYFVGNVMIESLIKCRPRVEESRVLEKLGLKEKEYVLTTLHRPTNVDSKDRFQDICNALHQIQQEIKVIFPAHPRTQERMKTFDLQGFNNRLIVMNPLGYFDFLALEMHARFVLTDSGGIQEETTLFGVPCLTIRENTERPITITEGTNTLVGVESEKIIQASYEILTKGGKRGRVPEYWDDKVSQRIVKILF